MCAAEGAGKIYGLMIEIQRRVGVIPKSQQASQAAGGFRYRGVDPVVAAIHPHLADVGVFVASELIQLTPWEYQTSGNKTMQAVTVQVAHRFYADDGSYVKVVVAGTNSDTGDRATTQAQTASYRDALLQVFSSPVCGPAGEAEQPQREAPAQSRDQSSGQQSPPEAEPLITQKDIRDIAIAAYQRAVDLGAAKGMEAEELRDAILDALCSRAKIGDLPQLPARGRPWALEYIEAWTGQGEAA